nr:competence protein CoiA family protein [Streptomyces alanosinicus]
MHPEKGRIDATVPDLGCGWAWGAVHRVRPRAALTCPECGHGVRAKVSHLGLRFFAHDPGAPTCGLAGESMEHRLLKVELVTAVREAGWHGALEVSAPDGRWRADVMATSPDGTLRMAWEAQLSSITEGDVRQRTDRYTSDNIQICWVATQPRRWRGSVPSVLARPPVEGQRTAWEVTEGLARFVTEPCLHRPPCPGGHGEWQMAQAPLRELVSWILGRRVVPHRYLEPERLVEHWWQQVWTSPQYVSLAADFAKARRRARRRNTATGTVQVVPLDGSDPLSMAREAAFRMTGVWPSRPRTSLRFNSRSHRGDQGAASSKASKDHGDPRLIAAAEAWVQAETGGHPLVKADQELAGGTPVYLDGSVYGIVCPDPDQLDWQRWPGRRVWVLFVACRGELKRIAVSAPNGVRIVILDDPDP